MLLVLLVFAALLRILKFLHLFFLFGGWGVSKAFLQQKSRHYAEQIRRLEAELTANGYQTSTTHSALQRRVSGAVFFFWEGFSSLFLEVWLKS